MKKYVLSFIVILITMCVTNKAYGLSKEFQFAIDTIGIPRYNTYGDEINEDVYYAYNIFSYGKPHKVNSSKQRWKNSKYGYWTKNGGKYNGTGTRGEYYILGKSYSGALIYNYYFPMDVIPSTTPDKWTFYTYPEATESWNDKTKYKYTEQLEYMKTSKLMFNDISSRAKADNPKYIKEYNITSKQIGLSKARLDTAATWKTYGMISTRRKISGVIYAQVYLVKPMAANADVKSSVDVSTEYILKEDQDELIIPIKYNTEVINMAGYANEKHIKEIKSMLYVNGEKIDEASGSKIISVGNEYMLVITREKFPQNKNHSVEITVDGYMHTEFVVDGLMRDKISKTINVYVEPKLIIPVKQSNLKVLEKNTLDWVVRPLAQTYETLSESVGFTEAGKVLIAKLELNVNNNELQNIQVNIDELNNMEYSIYNTSEDLVIKIRLPKTLNTTLFGEYSLREKQDSYFELSRNDIGKRKEAPHILQIKFEFGNKEYIEEIKFDTLDTYLSNVNTKIGRTTSSNIDSYIKLTDWIELKDE